MDFNYFQGSKVYAKAIEKVGLLTAEECKDIQEGLDKVRKILYSTVLTK